jgi:hypothetical protein
MDHGSPRPFRFDNRGFAKVVYSFSIKSIHNAAVDLQELAIDEAALVAAQ